MPKYIYTAKSLDGETKTGNLEAKDIHQLAQTLRQESLILIRARPEGLEKKKFNFSFSFFGVPLAEKLFFTRNLQVMISSGLPLPRALGTLALQAKSSKFKKALLKIKEEITKGRALSEAMISQSDIFSPLFQNMIKVGEEGGTLEEVLKTLTVQLEREHELKSRVRGAMIYPLVIISAMIGVGVLMLMTVVPNLAETFKDLNVQLPLTTRMVLALASFLTQKWYLMIIISVVLAFIFRQVFQSQRGKMIFDGLIFKLPIFSRIVKSTNSAFCARTLSSLISSGVSLPKSLASFRKNFSMDFWLNGTSILGNSESSVTLRKCLAVSSSPTVIPNFMFASEIIFLTTQPVFLIIK